MLRPRLIPCLLVQDGGLVKIQKFGSPKYVGDPVNSVRIFNEKEVDELLVLDVDATIKKKEPDFELISKLAAECRMPLSYGGGVKNLDQINRIIGLGVEKVCISSAAIERPEFVLEASSQIGSQSLVVVLDVKYTGFRKRPEVVHYNATKQTHLCPFEFALKLQGLGAGEIVINSVDLDGTMQGYDLGFAKKLKGQLSIPITYLGGAGSLEDVSKLWHSAGLVGASAGSMFVFKGKYRAVLISYPNRAEKFSLFENGAFTT